MKYMNSNKLWTILFITASIGISGIVNATESTILYEDRVVTDDGITFYKYVDSDGSIHSVVYDKNGKEIEWNDQMERPSDVVGKGLAEVLKDTSQDEMLVVRIALRDPEEAHSDIETEHGFIEVEDGKVKHQSINAIQRNLFDKNDNYYIERENKLKARLEKRRQLILDHTMDVVDRLELNIPLSEIEKYAVNGESMMLTMKKSELRKFIESNKDMIAAIDLLGKEIDGISNAMISTRVNQMNLFQSNPGDGIGIYMTENGCPNPVSGFTNYHRLTGSQTDHSMNVSRIIRAVSPQSFLYCRGGPALPNTSELSGVSGNPQIFIMSRSNGNAASAAYDTVDRDWDNFQYTHLVFHINSAGNEGNGTGFISSPGKALNSVTVGNYVEWPRTIASSSSYVDPSTKNSKPELSAPGTDITAGGFTMSGTSMAAPHVAGIAANFMSEMPFLQLKPTLAKAHLMASALSLVLGSGFDRAGVGGIRYPEGMTNIFARWWNGASISFESGLTTIFNISSIPRTKARVVVAWSNRGTWTYDHRNDAHPIGMDFDIIVYDPNGNIVGSSASWDNPFEWVDFTPTMIGDYQLEIRCYINRDKTSSMYLAAWIHKGMP